MATKKEILLKNKQKQIIAHTLVDDEDYEWLSQWKWHKDHSGYAIRSKIIGEKGNRKQKTIRMATEIMKKHGLYDKNKFIDHINRNKLDNRKRNLRMATPSQNQRNKNLYKNNKSGYRGVYYKAQNTNNPWKANIGYKNKTIHLGYFSTKEEAVKAYNKKAKELHGEFAFFNFEK